MAEEESGCNTEIKKPKSGGKPFVKNDPRINRKGRPKSFDQLRALAQKLSHEIINPDADKKKQTTATDAILRKIAIDDPKLFLEIAYGKVPNPIEISGIPDKLDITVQVINGEAVAKKG